MILSKERERQNRKILKEGGSWVWNFQSMTECVLQTKEIMLQSCDFTFFAFKIVIRSHKKWGIAIAPSIQVSNGFFSNTCLATVCFRFYFAKDVGTGPWVAFGF